MIFNRVKAGLWFDETSRTLLAGDLFSAIGDGPAVVDTDLVENAIVGEEIFHSTSIGRTFATSRIHSEVRQAQGQIGSK